ncbi:MAG: hypothetical protein UT48_C0005G0019 [Parcubacteria group bacterium GW2011_GWE2_39_37]|uniref:Uncharacterized protein n=1 Tax=Candidatus Falkowbacteria bacterium GW2011_GWF2_39_8 TaxID=1618642 RepID=A0A0G0PYG4_9BACT|nr:MAG: hypothetical protein UT48_C0005G0019 [Parcubacteria group bacterium GW2011_GWE2_39_37]KKR32943.1 MAG: hypothetical protein UT64_C0018G0006 [Candidatus Falkowbacteria bacterium GW2011_GWF2_39_8]
MINPNLSQKETARFTPNEDAKKLFQTIYAEQHKGPILDDEPRIRVSDVISKFAFYYEKIRNTVDDTEEHLLHKNAIDRILKRQINIEMSKDGTEIARHLLIELIRAGYLPNNQILESKIGEIGAVINKYFKLKKYCQASIPDSYENKKEIVNWIISLAACDIEERLGRNKINQVIVANLYDSLSKAIKLPDGSPYAKDREIQIYIGIHRNYFKADRAMVSLILFKYFISNWHEAGDEEAGQVAKNIIEINNAINFQINHPISGQLNKIINRYTVYFSILTEVIAKDPAATYEDFRKDPKAFPRNIKMVCNKRYKTTRAKLWRAAIRSILYLFITKMILILILEIPIANLLGETINNLSLAINVSFPPLLLFLIILFTKLPGDANTAKIIEGIEEITFVEKARKEPITLRPPAKRSKAKTIFFNTVYTITFFLSFGFVVWALNQLNFNIISIVIFLFFLALISFFSIRIRKRVRELFVIEPKENFIVFIIDFFYIPIIAVGKWLSQKFSRLNVLVFILDFIIEAPFKIFVEIAEEWTKYVKERKEDINQ